MRNFLKSLIVIIAVVQLNGCIDSNPEITTGSNNSNKLAATEIASKEKAIDKIRTLIEIIKISSLDAATKAALEAKLNAAIASLENPDLDSSTLSKILEDVKNLQTEVGTKTGTGGTSTPAPDTSAPPALSAFTGATGVISASVNLTITYPATITDYDVLVIRRSTGATAPANCSSGTSVKSYTSFSDTVYADATPAGGTAYSYRACIYDAAGNVTSSNVAENIISYQSTHTMFVTSIATYTGNLGGFSGADATCQSLASGAGLSGNKWRAILSSAGNHAKDRIIVSGTIYNTAGAIIANNKTDLWDGGQGNPILTEFGVTQTGGTKTITSSTTAGAYSIINSGTSCLDWTTASASYLYSFGYINFYSDYRWTNDNATACNMQGSIFCISQPAGFDLTAFSAAAGTGSNGDIDVTITFPATSNQFQSVDVRRISGAVPPNSDCASDGTIVKSFSTGGFTSQTFTDATGGSGVQYSYRACVYDTVGTLQASSYVTKTIAKGPTHKMFITSTAYNGNLGGLAGADAKCVTRATAGGLANAASYKAVISAIGFSATSNVTISGPVYSTNNDLLATNGADLFDGTVANKPVYSEFGNYYWAYVWTGSQSNGTTGAETCSDWTNSTAGVNGVDGDPDNVSWWLSTPSSGCNATSSLYCISQ